MIGLPDSMFEKQHIDQPRAEGSPAPNWLCLEMARPQALRRAVEFLASAIRQTRHRMKFLTLPTILLSLATLANAQEPPLPAATETPSASQITRPELNIP